MPEPPGSSPFHKLQQAGRIPLKSKHLKTGRFRVIPRTALGTGIGSYLKAVSPRTEVVGCWPENSPVLHECLRAGRVIAVPEQPTLSESTAGGLEPDSVTLPLCQKAIDTSVFVSETEIRS